MRLEKRPSLSWFKPFGHFSLDVEKEALAGSKSTIMYKNMSPRLAFGHKTATGGGSFQQGKVDIGVNAGRVTLKLIKH